MISIGDKHYKSVKRIQIPGMCQGETENINGNINFDDLKMIVKGTFTVFHQSDWSQFVQNKYSI